MSEIEIKISDFSDEFLATLEERIPVALEACGLQAERYAKKACPVDTGLLRNSITHVVSGQKLMKTYHATYGKNRGKTGKRLSARSKNAGYVGWGAYSGQIGSEKDYKVFVGTNVHYSPSVECGHSLPSGGTVPSRPFLKPAIADHKDKYASIIKAYLQKDS